MGEVLMFYDRDRLSSWRFWLGLFYYGIFGLLWDETGLMSLVNRVSIISLSIYARYSY